MPVPHPIPYQGSKRGIADRILAYFPDDAARLIEPFAGSAAVSISAAYHHKVQEFVIADLNEPLTRLWSEIIDRPHALAAAYEELWHEQVGRERAHYNCIRDRFNQGRSPQDFLYLLARCVKASVRYNAAGQFNQSPDNRRRGMSPRKMRDNILGASHLLAGRTRVVCADYRQVLLEALPSDIVYMDPPYQGVCGNRDPRYIKGVSLESFSTALKSLNDRGISFIVSYDGRTGVKRFGRPLPDHLVLTHIEVDAGRSSQATLLGREDNTFESLYLSPALVNRLGLTSSDVVKPSYRQKALLEVAP